MLWARDPASSPRSTSGTKIRSTCPGIALDPAIAATSRHRERRCAGADAALLVGAGTIPARRARPPGAASCRRRCRCCSAPRGSRRARSRRCRRSRAEILPGCAACGAVGAELRRRGRARPADRGDDRQPRSRRSPALSSRRSAARVSGPIRRPTRSASRSAARSRTCWRSPAASSTGAVSATMPARR